MGQDLARLKLVRIGRPVRRAALGAIAARIREAFGGALRELELIDYEPPAVERIEAGLLTRALDEELGGHILGITAADLVDTGSEELFNFMFGCKDDSNQVALVSTRRIGHRQEGRWLGRLLKVALHELGHNFGLVHHYSFAAALEGGCCPMSKGDYNRHGERSYVRSVIDARGFHFCDDCRRFLRLTSGGLRAG